MSRPSPSNAVSLFPFLAVLLCAMGALILLLLLLTRQIRDDATRQVSARTDTLEPAPAIAAPAPQPDEIPTVTVVLPPPAVAPAPDPDEPYRGRLAALRQERKDLMARVAGLRSVITDRDRAEGRVRSEVAALRFEADATAERLAARNERLEALAADRAQIAAAVAEARSRLAAAGAAAASAEPKVSVLAFDGLSGTPRRPILIECTGTHLRFLPEDIALTPADLDGFLPDYNPLLAGTDILRGYWSDRDGAETGRPYVLLLVRPDGATAYYAARNLLRPLGDDTGYELITADMDLALPVVDPEARRLCRGAVDELLRQRTAILADIARGGKADGGAFKAVSSGRFDADLTDSDPTAVGDRWGRQSSAASGDAGQPSMPPAMPRESLPGLDPTLRPLKGAGFAGGGSPAGEIAAAVSRGSYRRGTPAPTENRLPSSEPLGPAAERVAREATASSREALDRETGSVWPSFDRRSNRSGKRQRWGESSPSAIIALEKSISVGITPTEIRVGSQPSIPLDEGGITGRKLDAVLTAAEHEIEAWGRPPRDFFWSPRMNVTVAPGATRHYDRLRGHLAAVGMPASGRIQLAPVPPPFLELEHVSASP